MPTIAYLSNQFPSPVEPYVAEEIWELRKRGIDVIPCSARHTEATVEDGLKPLVAQTLYLQPLQIGLLLRATWLCLWRFSVLADLVERVLVQGSESPLRRMRALLHTWLGAYYALRLEGRGVEHIHVHHGYFASWIAMVAARLLGIGFSMTLHGSDLLLHGAYLDTKLKHCRFCVTVSEFNRRHILQHYAGVEPNKVVVRRMGVDPLSLPPPAPAAERSTACLIMLAVGRLHPVKNHAFLARACRRLKDRGIRFLCLIAGEGGERPFLEKLIRDLDLSGYVKLLGHLPRRQLDTYYAMCDLSSDYWNPGAGGGRQDRVPLPHRVARRLCGASRDDLQIAVCSGAAAPGGTPARAGTFQPRKEPVCLRRSLSRTDHRIGREQS